MMNNALHASSRRWLVLACTVIGTVLVVPQVALAPPAAGKPKPVNKPPAAAKHAPGPKAVKPHPANADHPRPLADKVKPLPSKARPYLRTARLWHPHYGVAPSKVVWRSMGYPYYLGGTSYVVLPSGGDSGGAGDSPANDPQATAAPLVVSTDGLAGAEQAASQAEAYVQMQELVDLIYEWRTLNESPALHERLPSSASAEADTTLAAIRQANERFDQATRQAMLKLAQDESAEVEIDSARQHLEKLAALAEALPTTGKGS